MHTYSITPLDTAHVDEICANIKKQYDQGVTTCALFSMPLVPEGDPVLPKAEQMCAKYDLFREKLSAMGIPSGILAQCTIGHGYKLNSMFPFTKIVSVQDGTDKIVVCPYDKDFREHMRHTFSVLASHNPDCIMVDDDFRLIARAGVRGCACHLHLDAFEKKAGVRKSREEIRDHLLGYSKEDQHYTDVFVQTQIESLVECAKIMREGIDSVNPSLPGIFCCCGNAAEGAVKIATALAGKGNPVIVRINNGNYTPAGARYFTEAMNRGATQIAVMRGQGHVDHFLAETDTCPQNRYSTGAQSLHSHFTGTLLEGAEGAKHWITRMRAFEEKSFNAYIKILAKNKGFYDAICQIVPTLKWRGCRIPLSAVPDYSFKPTVAINRWATHVLERFGLPMYFSDQESKVAFLEGNGDVRFTDDEIKQMLGKTLVLDGIAAENLCKRGFSELIGVTTEEWKGPRISGETFLTEKLTCNAQVEARKLVPINDKVVADSMCYHLSGGVNKEMLFPACTVYQNELGGTAIVFCGKVHTEFNYMQAFAFLNETRKNQLIRLLAQYGDLPVYYTEDEEVYMRAADCDDGSLMCALFNIGLDPIEQIRIKADRVPSAIECLEADGSRKAYNFDIGEDGVITIDKPAYTLNPVIFFIK